jgi:ribosomal peptide maturation radical SAM protein 1
VNEWGVDTVQAVDNVIDIRYFQETIPAMTRMEPPVEFFWEVRVNLTREQVRLLADAGIRSVQPGVESLNDHVLKLMRKGTTALQNIQFLKWCREYGIRPNWNLLYGFPGETQEDYAETMALLPAIRFLEPPTAGGPIRLDRFSPYFVDPERYGLRNIRPMQVYQHLYPFDNKSLSRIAYYFDYEYEPAKDPTGFASQVIQYVNDWRENPDLGALCSINRPDGTLVLVDTRRDALGGHLELRGPDRAVYEYCDRTRSINAVARHVAELLPDSSLARDEIKAFLDYLVARRLMVNTGDRYLSLATRASTANDVSIGP